MQKVCAGLSDADYAAEIDLLPYMNQSPFSVPAQFLCTFAFRLFRSMGLRHLCVGKQLMLYAA